MSPSATPPAPPTADDLRRALDAPSALTVGLEEEILVLDPETLDLAPVAEDVLAATGGDARFKRELPAAQLEILTAPAATVGAAARELAEGRAALLAAAGGRARFAGAGAHPFAAPDGVLSGHERYAFTRAEFGPVARRQLVFGLHVHVAVRGADRALAVYNALRAYLPELAALGANAPFYDGKDSGLASVRPKLCELLPRQGVPPALRDLEELADAYRWTLEAGVLTGPAQWWWELRLHPLHATVEVRVPDAQATVADSAALGAVVHALVARLADRHDAGDLPGPAETWRIEENRWSACRHGTRGRMADLETGRSEPTDARLGALLDELEPDAERLGCAPELTAARALVQANGAARQREAAGGGGAVGATAWLADRFVG
jgi:glutamate---cysteine ligase / carboxylate-amine ligase